MAGAFEAFEDGGEGDLKLVRDFAGFALVEIVELADFFEIGGQGFETLFDDFEAVFPGIGRRGAFERAEGFVHSFDDCGFERNFGGAPAEGGEHFEPGDAAEPRWEHVVALEQ